MLNNILLLLLTGLLGALIPLIQLRAERRKNSSLAAKADAEAAESLVRATEILIEPLSARILELETEVAGLKAEMTQLKAQRSEMYGGCTALVRQVKALGHEPVYIPPKSNT
jgi:uncharacterized small protein (DUF1192 family)